MLKPSSILALVTILILSACGGSLSTPTPDWSGYNPFVTVGPGTPLPLVQLLPPTRGPGTPAVVPTPDAPHGGPTPRDQAEQYMVQGGDTLGTIADRYSVSLESLMAANGLSDPNLLSVGQVLTIPVPTPGPVGPGFKIIPDSELVYGPASALLDLPALVHEKDGYLASYTQDVDGRTLGGAEVILLVAQNYSVNPRLLLALLEYHSGWVTQKNPAAGTLDYPLEYFDSGHAGLYRQLTWTANELNRGYYLWRARAVSTWVLADGAIVPIEPTINAGTAGVQNLFAKMDDRPTWERAVTADGLFATYEKLFRYPFDLAIEPLVPPGLTQPTMQLPFAADETWSFTGGPHGGWDSGSAWAALDFAPPGEPQGCVISGAWVLAVADGLIIRAQDGAVVQDLDGDGYEQTGWTVLYMHISSSARVKPGTRLKAGDRIGHPSCEGGISNGTHLHLARRYNGEWIPADSNLPFVLDGWVSSGNGTEYDGYLKRGDQVVEAWDARNDLNQISR
jgi:murein DD-endopeptidase MepM/ murein hydrolase activator NlpD